MVKLEIQLMDGVFFTETVESYNALEMEEKLNAREKIAISIGDSIYNKSSIRLIRRVETVVE